MLIDKIKHKSSLSLLWHRVFGDDYSFIYLIFNKQYDDDILCFASLDGEKAVSAFYLIKNELKFDNKIYSGYYLYAAATLPEYRKCGFMSKLINEAQQYCRENEVDFISLVPSEKSLYSYYSRFGFEPAMYRCESRKNLSKNTFTKSEKLTDINSILEIRRKFESNTISFHPTTFGYAVDCLKNSGFEFIALSDDSYFLHPDDEDSYSEFFSTHKNLTENMKRFNSSVSTVTSPFKLEAFEENEVRPYGMIYPINPELKREWKFTDIYMNIALD